jgi:uncharacterized membrane protein YkoI
MTSVLRPARAPRRASSLLAVTLLLAAGVLTGCENPDFEPREVLPMVEVTYDEAIQMSEKEVKDSDFVSIDLHESRTTHPEWHTVVVDPKDTSSLVRVSASSEEVLSSRVLPPAEAPDKKQLDLVDSMKIIPEVAVKKVTKPDFGKVTAIHPDEYKGEPVWTIVVATLEGDHRYAYEVDGVTGEVLERRSVGAGESTLPTPVQP